MIVGVQNLISIIGTAVLLGVALWVVFAKTGLSKYLEELFGSVGREHGDLLVERGRRRRRAETGRFRTAMAALRASSAKASALPVPTSTSKGAGQVLGLGLVAVTGPFVGQKPIVAIVGPDAAPATEAMRPAIAHWSEGNDVLVVQVGGTALLASIHR